MDFVYYCDIWVAIVLYKNMIFKPLRFYIPAWFLNHYDSHSNIIFEQLRFYIPTWSLNYYIRFTYQHDLWTTMSGLHTNMIFELLCQVYIPTWSLNYYIRFTYQHDLWTTMSGLHTNMIFELLCQVYIPTWSLNYYVRFTYQHDLWTTFASYLVEGWCSVCVDFRLFSDMVNRRGSCNE